MFKKGAGMFEKVIQRPPSFFKHQLNHRFSVSHLPLYFDSIIEHSFSRTDNIDERK